MHQFYSKILWHYVELTVSFGRGFSLSLILMLFCPVSVCVPIENDFCIVEISSLVFPVYLLFLFNYLERFVYFLLMCMCA